MVLPPGHGLELISLVENKDGGDDDKDVPVTVHALGEVMSSSALQLDQFSQHVNTNKYCQQYPAVVGLL